MLYYLSLSRMKFPDTCPGETCGLINIPMDRNHIPPSSHILENDRGIFHLGLCLVFIQSRQEYYLSMTYILEQLLLEREMQRISPGIRFVHMLLICGFHAIS
jgi:hypothetical protein